MITLLAFITITFAKCGLWYEFNRDQSTDGPRFVDLCNGYRGCNYRSVWGTSYSYESMGKQEVCDDIEMLEQCKRAQQVLDLFSTLNSLPLADLGCASHVVCAAPPSLFPYRTNTRNQYWCQNIDSYNLCIFAQFIIRSANSSDRFPINCVTAAPLIDHIPVINYTQPSAIKPIEPVDPGNTTISNTTFVLTTTPAAPVSASKMFIGLVTFLCVVLLA